MGDLQIILIRHGKTTGNLSKAYIGRTDQPLHEGFTDEILKRSYPSAETVYSSPLQRCIQTAGLIYPEKTTRIRADLRECDFGDFEGRSYEQLKENPDYQKWLDSCGTTAFPNGEDPSFFRSRCAAEFKRICGEAVAEGLKKIAVVCHGGTIMAILDAFSDPHLEFYHWQIENAGGFIFEYNEKLSKAASIHRLKG